MRYRKLISLTVLLTSAAGAGYFFQDKKIGKGSNSFIRYELVKNWLKLPDKFVLGNPTGITVDTNQNLIIFHRGSREWPFIGSMPDTYIKEKTILLIEKETGIILNSWGANLFIMPHGLTVDEANNVWVTDVGLHQVFKFDHEGQLLMKLGVAKISGNDDTHFNRPTSVAVTKDGSFYVSDGYGNSRIIKFAANGKYLFEWGRKGDGIREFDIPHAIDADAEGNLYVADRENNRIQVFNTAGKFLKQYSNKDFGNICSVKVDKNTNDLFVTDDLTFLKIKHRGSDIFTMDTSGVVQTRFGRSSFNKGKICWYHDIAVDAQQNIYVGDILNNQIQKFRKISSP